MLQQLKEKIKSITGLWTGSHNDVASDSKDLEEELFGDIATHISEAEDKGDDWILFNNWYRRFLVVHSLPSVIDLSVEKEAPLDKIPNYVESNYTIHPTSLKKSELKHMRRNSVLRSRHRLVSERNNSTTQRCDARLLREHRMSDQFRDTEYIDLSLFFDVSARDLEPLEVYTDWVMTELKEDNIGIERIRFRNEDAFETASPLGSELLQHRIRMDGDTATKVIVHFTFSHRRPSEEYINTQLDRLEKYVDRNVEFDSEDSGEDQSAKTKN